MISSKKDTVAKQNLQSKNTSDPICQQRNVEKKNLSSSQAMRKLKKKLSKQGIKDELHPIPEGSAQFMLGWAQGKTRPLLHLYDTGCGSVLFKKGVPLLMPNKSGARGIHTAASKGHVAVVNSLIVKGENVDAATNVNISGVLT